MEVLEEARERRGLEQVGARLGELVEHLEHGRVERRAALRHRAQHGLDDVLALGVAHLLAVQQLEDAEEAALAQDRVAELRVERERLDDGREVLLHRGIHVPCLPPASPIWADFQLKKKEKKRNVTVFESFWRSLSSPQILN